MGGFRTFAETRSGDKVAPIPVVRRQAENLSGFAPLKLSLKVNSAITHRHPARTIRIVRAANTLIF